ncbi:hypothetical protein HALLA_12160 [Halostagnicola larsenii XH-48]|uniref:Uncharacterized protein n=1 Tax=Halostagnicola larsenii XH-48 TaxID=797299 RepID=W0JQV1_9EURY|nr:hypothetical protein [Halostagnicola larsenii]AHG00979.1 hypothetical protein HALLA_12160 [Halostagnicola larsenii XH-48]
MITPSGTVGGVAFDQVRFTNVGRDQARDVWGGADPVAISEIAVGDAAEGLSRNNTELGNELERVSVSESFPDLTSADYSASVTETAIREIGLFNADGDMISRATIPESEFSSPVDVEYTLTVENDDSTSKGVLTDAGQEAVRDALVANDPNLPTQYAYGSDVTDPTTGDTALGDEVIVLQLDELLIGSSGDEPFSSFVDPEPTDPVVAEADEVRDVQSNFIESRRPVLQESTASSDLNSDYVGGSAYAFQEEGDYVIYEPFELEYLLEADNIGIGARFNTDYAGSDGNNPTVELALIEHDTETEVGRATIYEGSSGLSLFWRGFGDDDFFSDLSGDSADAWTDGDIEPGTYHFRLEATSNPSGNGEETIVDIFSFFDTRYDYYFDSEVNEFGDLDGPELYPDQAPVEFTTSTRRDVTEAVLETEWNDTSNEQFIGLRNTDAESFITASNTDTLSANFPSSERGVTVQYGFSRYPQDSDPQEGTPRYGHKAQAVTRHDLTANVAAITPDGIGMANLRAIIQPDEIVGETLREAGQLADDGTLLSRSVFAEFEVEEQQRVISSESITWSNP